MDERLADHCLDFPEIGDLFSKVEVVRRQQNVIVGGQIARGQIA